MSLTAVLRRVASLERPGLPDIQPLESRKNRILGRWPDTVAYPPEKDRERLVLEMRSRLESGQWNGTTMSFVTAAARALFDEDRRLRPDLQTLRNFYVAEIRASTRPAFLNGMFSVYLSSFQPKAPHTIELASALNSARSKLGFRYQCLIENAPEVLDPARAADAIAMRMLRMEDCWQDLKLLGLQAPHAPGLMDYAHLEFVRLIGPSLEDANQIKGMCNWLKPPGHSAKMSGASAAVSALLRPWVSGDPPQKILSFLTDTLIDMYGDPRVARGGAWAGVPADALDVIFRWLTGENIRFFLDVVSAVEESHMWAPRRQFWLKLHQQKRIDAAWVAFSKSGAEHARKKLSVGDGRSRLHFGTQTAGGSRIDTSLLILKIGSKIVVEGSHNYKVHIFRETDRRAPKLYQAAYDCEIIRLTAGAESKSHNVNWQSWVLERI